MRKRGGIGIYSIYDTIGLGKLRRVVSDEQNSITASIPYKMCLLHHITRH